MQDKANGTRLSLDFLAYEPFEKFIDKNFGNDLDQLAELVDHCMLLLVDQTGNGQNDIRRKYYHLRTIRDLLFDLHLMLVGRRVSKNATSNSHEASERFDEALPLNLEESEH